MQHNLIDILKAKGITKLYAYSRKSRDVDGEGLQKHHDIIVDFCNSLSIPLEPIFEEVESSETLSRPVLTEVRQLIKSKQVKALVVYRLDRLTRKTTDLERLLQEFKFFDLVLIEAHRGKIVDYNDTLSTKLESVMSDLYQEQSKLVLNAGKKKAVSIYGNHLGEAPLGYEYNPKTKKLQPNEQAFLIRLIFDMYVEGKSTTAIAIDLNQKGHRTRKAALFTSHAIHVILNNEKYIGTQIYGKREWYKDSNGKEMSKAVPQENWIIYENAHEGLVSVEQFQQVKQLLKDNLLVPVGARKRKFSLSNVLKCGVCGRFHVFHHIRGREYMKPCVNQDMLTGKKCSNGAIALSVVEEYIRSQIWTTARPAIFHVKEKIASGEKYVASVETNKSDLLQQQRDINKQLDTILDLMIQRGIDQRLLDREQILKSQLSDIESQLSALTSDEEGIDEYPHITAFFNDTSDLSSIPWKWKHMSSEEKNVLFKKYIDYVTYTKTGKNEADMVIKWNTEVENAMASLEKWKQEVKEKRGKKSNPA